MRLVQVLSALSFLSFTHAWPAFGGSLPAVDGLEVLFKRQNNNGGGNNNGAQAATITNAGTAQTNQANQATTGTITASATLKTGSATLKKNGTTVIDPRSPAGGISMITPNTVLGPSYYKIGDWVHFAWNYTSLLVTPTAINVIASCSAASRTYTLAMNQTIEPTGDILWDTGSYQQTAVAQLLTNEYTLIVWDANQAISATPQAGELAPYSQFTFGMYVPQPYQNWSSYQCPTCNGAASLERMTIHFLLGMAGITVLSFTWFVTNLSAF